MTGADYATVNELVKVLREYRRLYHSIPDSYGYCHLGAVSSEVVRRADEVIARADRVLAQPWGDAA